MLGMFHSRGYNSSMKSGEALRLLADITGSQWGMVTSAQAGALGVTRLNLSRLTDAGHLERLTHGVYRDAGAPIDEFEELRAAWLSTEPKLLAEQRIQDLVGGVVIAGASAALLHGVGDLWADRHEFVCPKRRQSQRSEIRYRQRALDPTDVTLVQGLPSMTIECTIVDLITEVGDLSLVADVLGSAARKRRLALGRLQELLAPLAERHGFKRADGQGLMEALLERAGLDRDSLAAGIAADSQLTARVLGKYLAQLDFSAFEDKFPAAEVQQALSSALAPLVRQLEAGLLPHAQAAVSNVSAALTELAVNGNLEEIRHVNVGGTLASALATVPQEKERADDERD